MPTAFAHRDIPILLLDLADFTKNAGIPKKRLVIEELQKVAAEAARFFMPYGNPWEKWKRHGTGDGYYFLFDALDAVVAAKYALEIRDGLAAANATLAGDAKLRARIVLAHGDVEMVDDQLLSDQFAEAERFISDDCFKKHAAALAEPAALACTELFHAHWQKAAAARKEKTFAAARALEWSEITVTDKHGYVWRGYINGQPWEAEKPKPEAPPPPPPLLRVLVLVAHSIREPLPEAVELATHFVRDLEAAGLAVEVRLDAATVTNLRREALRGCDLLVYYGHGDENGRLCFLDGNVDYSLLVVHRELKEFFASLKGALVFACHSERFAVSLPGPWLAFSEPILTVSPRPFLHALCQNLVRENFDKAVDRTVEQARVQMHSNLPKCLQRSDKPFPALQIARGKAVCSRTMPALTDHCDVDFGSVELDDKRYPEHDPFVGRDTELSQLLELPGPGQEARLLQLWWVHGDAGIGKSALLRQHAANVRDLAFHEGDEPVWLLHLHCYNFVLLADAERGICEKAAHLYHFPAPEKDLRSLFGRLKTMRGTHVWILDDLTYLRSEEGDRDPASRLAASLALLAGQASVPMQIVASARFSPEVNWHGLKVEPLERGDALRLAVQVWRAKGQEFPLEQSEDVTRLLAYCGRSTVHFKRALLLAVELDLPVSEFLRDQTGEATLVQDKLEEISRRMVRKEVELLGRLETGHGFAYRAFLGCSYRLLLRAGQFTREELESWFGERLRVGAAKTVQSAYNYGLIYLVRFGFLGLRREKGIPVYYMPPNQRLILKGLGDSVLSLPVTVPLRAPKARLSAALEGVKAGSRAAWDELLSLRDDYWELAHEPQAALAVVYSMRARAEQLESVSSELQIQIYREIDESFGKLGDADVAEQVAVALFNKGVALGQADRVEESLAAFDEVARRFAGRPEPALAEQVAKALFNKGVVLGRAGRVEEELAAFDEVARRFAGRPEPALAEQVAKALFNKGVALGQADRVEEELAAYDEVERRYGGRTEPAIAEQVAKALVYKGITFRDAGTSEEAVAVCQEVERRYGASTEPTVVEYVAKAKRLREAIEKGPDDPPKP
jgi:tetratricopeptide (TPR) repeat protein